MDYDYKAEIDRQLARASELRTAIADDRNLSDTGRVDAVRRVVDPLEAGAAADAAAWLQRLQRAGERAEAAHLEAKRAAAAAVDHDRRDYFTRIARERIEYGAWDDVQRGLDDAFELGDVDQLHAWNELANRVRAKFDNGAGAASDPHKGVVTYMARLQTAIDAAEPADVRTTRDALTTAADALNDARAYLENQDHLRQRYRNVNPLFRDVITPRPEPVVEDMGGGRYAISTPVVPARGAFGA